MPTLGRQPTNSPMTLNSSASSSCMTMGLNSGFFGWRLFACVCFDGITAGIVGIIEVTVLDQYGLAHAAKITHKM